MAILFENGRVIIGNGEFIERGTVVINGKRIEFVGPLKKSSASRKDRVFDLSGKTILPGLIDAHVHLCVDGSPDPLFKISKGGMSGYVLTDTGDFTAAVPIEWTLAKR